MEQSIWIDTKRKTSFPILKETINVDVAIIGGGICGVTAANLLKLKGYNVALLEGTRIGESNSGRSTGNLYGMVDIPLQELRSKYSDQSIKQIIDSRLKAMHLIEENIKQFEIECNFQHVPWLRFSGSSDSDHKINKEFEIAKELGLDVIWLNSTDDILIPVKGRCGFMLENQAQFDPFQYVQQLARGISKDCCHIYENSRVEDIQSEDDFHLLVTANGKVHARHIFYATHTPLGISALQTVLGPYREYGVAGKIKNRLTMDGIYWGHYEKDKVTSIRACMREEEKYAMIIGRPHKVGQGDSREEMDHLKKVGMELNLIEDIAYEWGGQHYRPADYLPYIGQTSASNAFVATGFSTDGLTYGTLAAMIVSDLISGQSHPDAHLYRSNRVTPLKSARKFLKENLNVMKQYLLDYLHHNGTHDLAEGEGTIVDFKGQKYAVSKNQKGEIKVCSAICSHLGCVVHWNRAEGSWDCPCHGSRFKQGGEVIEGPAFQALTPFSSDMEMDDIRLPPSRTEYVDKWV